MINIKPEYLAELQKIFNEYCPKAEIWAYGSRIKDDFHSGSDLDLVVKNFHEDGKYLYELKELLNDSSIPFVIDINEFDKLPQTFKDEINKLYVKIYPKN